METIAKIVYFSSVLGGLPAFIVLDAFALVRFRGWARLLPLVPAAYVGWTLSGEFGPELLHWREMDSDDFWRFMYERWSALSGPAIYASAFVLALLVLRRLWR